MEKDKEKTVKEKQDQNETELRITDIHLMIRRKKTTLYLDMLETDTVFELKKRIEAIFKVQPVDQQLFIMSLNDKEFDKPVELSNPVKALSEYDLTSPLAMITSPAIIGLAVRQEDGSLFESLEITKYSDIPWSVVSDLLNEKFAENYKKVLKDLKRTRIPKTEMIN